MNKKHAEFGAYALVYTGTENNMRKRGVPAIALKASNDVGGCYFMSLYTGKKIHGYIWNEIPIDDDVISRVEELADKENQPLLIDDHPLFEWAPGRPIASDTTEDIELDNKTEQEVERNEVVQEVIPQVINEDEDKNEENQDTNKNYVTDTDTIRSRSDEDFSVLDNNILDIEDDMENNLNAIMDDINESRYEKNEGDNDISSENDEAKPIFDDIDEDAREHNVRTVRKNAGAGVNRLEPSMTGKSHGDIKKQIQFLMKDQKVNDEKDDFSIKTAMKTATRVMFTQMGASKGIKLFGERAVSAMTKELKQL
jgi:hypothetical protein